MALKDILIETLSGAVESIAESKLVEVLQTLHDKNQEAYWAAIHGGKALVAALKPITDGTSTKIDDAVIDAIDHALTASAALNAPKAASTNDTGDGTITDPNQPPPPGGPGGN